MRPLKAAAILSTFFPLLLICIVRSGSVWCGAVSHDTRPARNAHEWYGSRPRTYAGELVEAASSRGSLGVRAIRDSVR